VQRLIDKYGDNISINMAVTFQVFKNERDEDANISICFGT
jgi:hypothetical protein